MVLFPFIAEVAKIKLILHASLASHHCFSRSYLKRYWLRMDISAEQMAEHLAFSDGLISSLCDWASHLAMVSTCCLLIHVAYAMVCGQ